MPGDPVVFTDTTRTAVQATYGNLDAIVDPFIFDHTVPGQLFWVILRPELVSNLHHQFEIGEGEPDYERERVPAHIDDDGCTGSWCDDH